MGAFYPPPPPPSHELFFDQDPGFDKASALAALHEDSIFLPDADGPPNPLYLQTPSTAASSTFQSSSPGGLHHSQTLHTPPSVSGHQDPFMSPDVMATGRRTSAAPSHFPYHDHAPAFAPSNIPVQRQDAAFGDDAFFFEQPRAAFAEPAFHHATSVSGEPVSVGLVAQEPSSMTLEELLNRDPFQDSTGPESWTTVPEIEEDGAAVSEWNSLGKSLPSPSQSSFMVSAPPSKTYSCEQVDTYYSPKRLKKAKSYTNGAAVSSATLKFSLKDCSSEFHMFDNKFAFQDETALFSGSKSAISKKKSSSKLGRAAPTLHKAKTSANLCLKSSSQRVLKNMESGLLSFQIKLKNGQPDSHSGN